MSSSTDSADNTSTCVVDKEGDGSSEDVAAKQLALQIDHLSIENEGGDIPASSDNADNTDNITITILCAACGKEGEEDNMNICNKCKTVHYCNVACKKKHKSKHNKKCDRRVAELHEEALFSEPPLREECPICMLPLPLDTTQTEFKSCCGKIICSGCIYAMAMEDIKKGKKELEEHLCAFCRTPETSSDEERNRMLEKLAEKGNADAYNKLAVRYNHGTNGMQQDWVKANELWLKAGELGCAEAYCKLGCSYTIGQGVAIDKKKAVYYLELAAMEGDVNARHFLGCMEGAAGNEHRAFKHIIIAARAGHEKALSKVKDGFQSGCVAKDEYASTLRLYQKSQTEMKSEARALIRTIMEPNLQVSGS